jgi:hypothetical protein
MFFLLQRSEVSHRCSFPQELFYPYQLVYFCGSGAFHDSRLYGGAFESNRKVGYVPVARVA